MAFSHQKELALHQAFSLSLQMVYQPEIASVNKPDLHVYHDADYWMGTFRGQVDSKSSYMYKDL
jgi:hypothetical protein